LRHEKENHCLWRLLRQLYEEVVSAGTTENKTCAAAVGNGRQNTVPLISYVRDGLYEFCVTLGSNEYRLFFIYDGNTVVVLLNCFKKKSQKAPNAEIKKALRLKKEYYEQKESDL